MKIYLKSGAMLASYLKPDKDQYTRELDVEGRPTLKEIVEALGIPEGLIAFAVVEGRYERLDYKPSNNEQISLLTPVAGG